MDSEDQRLQRLRAALDELTASDAAEILAEARIHARERARRMLTDALVESMLANVRRQVARPSAAPTAAPAPAPAPAAAPSPEPPAASAPAAAPSPEPPAASASAAASASGGAPAPEPAAARESAPPEPGELGWYVYGVINGAATPAWTLSGVDRGHAITTVPEGNVAAVASRVALEDFDEARLREHLADMGWVEATARAHEGVLEQTRAQATVIPMRMCTVYRSEDGVRSMLRREATALAEALAHLDGKTEMGVKVFADPTAMRADEPQPEVEGTGAGAAYMELRRRERDRAEEAAQRVEQAAEEIHERLQALAADAHLMPPQRPEASGHVGEMVMNGAYLVDDESLDGFRAEVAELQEAFASAGLELALTGPWPAYNFVPGTIGAAW